MEEKLTETEWLLLNKLDSLEQKVQESSNFSLREASAIVRHLIVDGSRLCDSANQKHRVKIRFLVGDLRKQLKYHSEQSNESILPNGLPWTTYALPLDPEQIEIASQFRPAYAACQVKVSEFLETECYCYGTPVNNIEPDRESPSVQLYTIQDIILTVAHVRGGVHSGNVPRRGGKREKVFKELNRASLNYRLNDMPAEVWLMKNISKNVLHALKPLREAIETMANCHQDGRAVGSEWRI